MATLNRLGRTKEGRKALGGTLLQRGTASVPSTSCLAALGAAMIPQDASEAHVVLLATGGSIASRSPPEDGEAAVAAPTGEQLLRSAASSLFLVRVATRFSGFLPVGGSGRRRHTWHGRSTGNVFLGPDPRRPASRSSSPGPEGSRFRACSNGSSNTSIPTTASAGSSSTRSPIPSSAAPPERKQAREHP